MSRRKRMQEASAAVRGELQYNSAYGLYLTCEEINTFGTYIALPGHGFNRAGDSQSDKFEVPEWSWDSQYNGYEQVHVVEPERTTQVEYEIHTPPRFSIIEELTESPGKCNCTVWEVRRRGTNCEYCERRAIRHDPAAPLGQAMPTETALIPGGVNDVERAARSKKTKFYTAGEGAELLPLRVGPIGQMAFGAYSILVLDNYNCEDGCYCPGDIFVGGNNGFARIPRTNHGYDFDSLSNLTTSLAAGYFIHDMVRIGGKIVGTWSDNSFSGGTTGGIFVYDIEADTMVNATVGGAAIATRMYRVTRLGNRLIAVGASGTILRTDLNNLTDWTALTHSVTTAFLTGVSANEDGVIFISGTTSVLLKLVGDNLVDISANVVGATGYHDVHAFAKDKIAIGGTATGVIWVSEDAGDTWVQVAIGAGSAVFTIAGTDSRLMVGSSTNVFEYSPLTFEDGGELYHNTKWQRPEMEGASGITGNIRNSVLIDRHGAPNFYFAVGLNGSVVYGRPCNTILC